MKDDDSDVSSNHSINFIKCDYCDKIYDNYRLVHLNTHISKTHPEFLDEYKQKYPDHFKKSNKTETTVNCSSERFPDYRLQEQSEAEYEYKCAICLYKFKGRKQATSHIIHWHNNMPFQIGNTVLYVDPKLDAEQRERQNFKYRCGHCLHCFSKIESIKSHLTEKHEGMEQLVYSIKGSVQENLEKVCMKTKICENMLCKYWKVDETLSAPLDESAMVDDDKNKRKMIVKRKKKVEVKVNKEEYNKILHNLNLIKKMDSFKTNSELKKLYESTLELMAKYA